MSLNTHISLIIYIFQYSIHCDPSNTMTDFIGILIVLLKPNLGGYLVIIAINFP
jgi:hypothetical protein